MSRNAIPSKKYLLVSVVLKKGIIGVVQGIEMLVDYVQGEVF